MKANDKKGVQFEITEEDYKQNLVESADPEHAPLPGKYVGRRGSFLKRYPEAKIRKIRKITPG